MMGRGTGRGGSYLGANRVPAAGEAGKDFLRLADRVTAAFSLFPSPTKVLPKVFPSSRGEIATWRRQRSRARTRAIASGDLAIFGEIST